MKTLPMLPGYGEPCNGCGYCCREELCGLAVEILGVSAAAPCPFLREHDGRTWCGVVEDATRQNVAFGGHMAWRLGIGLGCLVEKQPADPAVGQPTDSPI